MRRPLLSTLAFAALIAACADAILGPEQVAGCYLLSYVDGSTKSQVRGVIELTTRHVASEFSDRMVAVTHSPLPPGSSSFPPTWRHASGLRDSIYVSIGGGFVALSFTFARVIGPEPAVLPAADLRGTANYWDDVGATWTTAAQLLRTGCSA